MAETKKNIDPSTIEGYVDMQTKFEAYTGDEPYLFIS